MKDGVIIQEGTAEDILMNPANDYVARFIEGIDRTKVITAESVMIKNVEMAYHKTDGPMSALHKMKRNRISNIFVRKDGKLDGLVSADDASEAVKRGEKTLGNIVQRDIPTVSPETPACDLIPLLAEIKFPLAVVNDKKQLIGVVIRGSLLAGLAEGTQFGSENEEP